MGRLHTLMKWVALCLLPGFLVVSSAGCRSNAQKEDTIQVATQTPLSGNNAVLGEAIKLGAQLAVEDFAPRFEKLGFKLIFSPFDDQGDPKKGVANAQQIGADQSILGVVGHLNSGVAIPSSTTYEKYQLAMVSPANTSVAITDRRLKVVNRICARDDFQGAAAARFAVSNLKAKRVFIVQDKTAYGQGIADAFKNACTKLGATVVGYTGITPGEKDFNGVLNQITPKKPDLIYFGGVYAEGGILIKQAREKGIQVPILGGDGLDSSIMLKMVGHHIHNTFYTTVAADVSKTKEGKAFAARYEKKFHKRTESYSFYGYDAMGVLLTGIEKALQANKKTRPSRSQVRDQVRAIQDYTGIATQVGFDDKGDNTHAKVFVFKFNEKHYPGMLVAEESNPMKTSTKSK